MLGSTLYLLYSACQFCDEDMLVLLSVGVSSCMISWVVAHTFELQLLRGCCISPAGMPLHKCSAESSLVVLM